MAKKNRNSLKNAFQEGAQPSAQDFGDLIDSALNVIDDGFEKTDDAGLKVTQLGSHGKLMSFYKNISVQAPTWSLSLGHQNNPLHWCDANGQNALTLSPSSADVPSPRIGIHNDQPLHTLDVGGTIAARGRIGGLGGKVPADGQWHTILDSLEGCRAFEIMAGVGEQPKGRYALLHAIVLNTFNRQPLIDSRQSHYGSRCDKIELRWRGEARNYALQMRTRCAYGEQVRIQYHVTDLWFDPFMQQSESNMSEPSP